MKVTINGEVVEAVRKCNPIEADTYEEIFNSADAAMCMDHTSVNGYVTGLTGDFHLFDDYTFTDHAAATVVMVGKATVWCVEKTFGLIF